MLGVEHIDHVQAGMEAVAAMPGIVAHHARGGTRPRWSHALPEPFPDRGGNGKPRVLIDETFVQTIDRRGRVFYEPTLDPEPGAISYRAPVPCPPTRKDVYRQGAYCQLVYRPAQRASSRSAPKLWPCAWGLELLHQALTGRLTSIATLPAAAPSRPWAGELEVHGRPSQLFKGQRDEPYQRQTREQAAARRGALQGRRLNPRAERRDRCARHRPAGGMMERTAREGAKVMRWVA
jgi:hypothetical protein